MRGVPRNFQRTECYSIPDGEGGTFKVQLSKPPTEQTIASLQELAATVRKAAEERGQAGVSPAFASFLRRRRL